MAKGKKKQSVREKVASELGADVAEMLEAASQAQAHQVDSIGRVEMLADALDESWRAARKGRVKVRAMRSDLIETEIKTYLSDRRALLKSKTIADAIILRSHQIRDSFERVMTKGVEIQEVRRKSFRKSMRPLMNLLIEPNNNG